MIINKETINSAVRNGVGFIDKNMLPWGEIPTFKVDNGVEQTYVFMPIATAYYLDSSPYLSIENTKCENFLINLSNSEDGIVENKYPHPGIDATIKIQYVNYSNNFKAGLTRQNMGNSLEMLKERVKYIDDIAIELNYIELQSITNVIK